MSLYDRNYSQNSQMQYGSADNQGYTLRDGALVSFVRQTYQLFAGSLLAGTVGAYIGLTTSLGVTVAQYYIGFFILEIALLIGLFFCKQKAGLNLILLFAFTFVTGLTLTPILGRTFAMPNGASIVAQAFLLTTLIFGIMSIFALKTTKDLAASWGKMLFISLIVVVVASIVNIFLGNPILQVIIAGVVAIIFTLYIAYDTQNIIRGLYDSPVIAAVSLYLDVLNLFVALLQILGFVNSSSE